MDMWAGMVHDDVLEAFSKTTASSANESIAGVVGFS